MKSPISSPALDSPFTPSSHAAERAIEIEMTVSADIAEVWTVWTTSEGIKSFFAPDARVDLRVGGPFEVFFDPLAAPGSRGADGMITLAFQVQRMLSFTWNAPPSLPEARQQRTHVMVRFFATSATKTKVTLRHDGWGDGGEWDKAFDYFSKAWPKVMANLHTRFSDGPIDWTDWMARLRKNHEANPSQ